MSVLTVLTRRDEVASLARFSWHAARAEQRDLILLFLSQGAEAEPVEIDLDADPDDDAPPGLTEAREALLTMRHALRLEQPPHLDEFDSKESPAPSAPSTGPEIRLISWTAPDRLEAVLRLVQNEKVQLLIAAKRNLKRKGTPLARQLFASAPCRTLLVRFGDAKCETLKRILVPTSGGPNARSALRLGGQFAASQIDGRITALLIEPPAGELASEVGEQLLQEAIKEAGMQELPAMTARVELAEHRDEGIRKVADEGFDLLMIGASRINVLRRLLFGTIPDQLLAGDTPLVVAVVRDRRPWLERARASFGRWLEQVVPQLDREQRVGLFERLQSGSRWSFDFQLLIALSTAIAALGLLQNSSAVVIGAMLVAPLMTPILGAGLSLVQGNLPLLRTATRALVGGYLLALGVGFITGTIFPLPRLTTELLARGQPTLLDMGVAFLAGFAAAHCLGRAGLLAALPGVAIAAALVPPIATTGICLAFGEWATAKGSALLFGTNVVTIILGAALSLYASGLRGQRGASPNQLWVRLAFAILLLGAVGLVFPLGSGLLSLLRPAALAPLPQSLGADLDALLEAHLDLEMLSVRRTHGTLEVIIQAPAPVSSAVAREIAVLAQRHQPGQTLRLRTEIAVEIPAASLLLNPREDDILEGDPDAAEVGEGGDLEMDGSETETRAGEGGASEGGASEDGASEDGASEDGASEDGASEDGASEDGANENGANEDGSQQGGLSEVDDVDPSEAAEEDPAA